MIHMIKSCSFCKSCKSCQLLNCELLRQTSNPNLKLTRLNNRFVISTDKRQILAAKFEIQCATFTRLKIDLRESSQTFSRW